MLHWVEFKPFLIDSIKTIGKSLVLVFKYYWWLPVIFVWSEYKIYLDISIKKTSWSSLFASIFTNIANAQNFMTILGQAAIIILLLCFIVCFIFFFAKWFFILYLTTRSTDETKERSYYRNYSNKYWKSFFSLFILISILFILISILMNIYCKFKILTLLLAPFFWVLDFGIFFFLDSNQALIGALKKGLRLVFYFLPLCIVIQIPMIIYNLLSIFLDKKEMFALYPLLKSPGVAFLSALSFWVLLPIIALSFSATLYAKIKERYPAFF